MESQWQSRRHCCRPMGMRGLELCEFSMLPEICEITGIKTLSEQQTNNPRNNFHIIAMLRLLLLG